MAVVTQFPFIVNASSTSTGTALDAQHLNVFTLAQTCLVSGGVPVTSGFLTLAQPETQVIINTGTTAITLDVAAGNLTFAPNSDTYVDLDTTGTYHLNAGAVGYTPLAPLSTVIRLYKATSSGSLVTAPIKVLATTAVLPGTAIGALDESINQNPVPASSDTLQQTIWRMLYKLYSAGLTFLQTAVSYDATEPVSRVGTSSLQDNLAHMRVVETTLVNQSWSATVANTKAAILADGTNAGPSVTLPGSLVVDSGIAVLGTASVTGTAAFAGSVTMATGALTVGGKQPITADGTGAGATVTLPGALIVAGKGVMATDGSNASAALALPSTTTVGGRIPLANDGSNALPTLALPSTTTVGGKFPMISDGSNAAGTVNFSGNLNVANTLTPNALAVPGDIVAGQHLYFAGFQPTIAAAAGGYLTTGNSVQLGPSSVDNFGQIIVQQGSLATPSSLSITSVCTITFAHPLQGTNPPYIHLFNLSSGLTGNGTNPWFGLVTGGANNWTGFTLIAPLDRMAQGQRVVFNYILAGFT